MVKVQRNATQSLWEFLTKSRPDKYIVTLKGIEAYKQILVQSNETRS